ncbi:MAG: class I SAM-dependent methyltransferase [Candidatus Wallbacteria bacterium]|nr:class I SAM-dependent methyltransferase [Candidatus Wallbacteria bacterium]
METKPNQPVSPKIAYEMSGRGIIRKAAGLVNAHFDKSARILELGSGKGALAERLLDLGFKGLTCSDINADDFALLHRVGFLQIDGNSDFSGLFREPFDLVIALEVIEHLENPWHFFREVKKMLKPGGSLILSTPNIDSVKSRLEFMKKGRFCFFYDSDYRIGGHITPLPRFTLDYLIEKHGFRVRHYERNAMSYLFHKPGHIIQFLIHRLLASMLVKKPDFGECHIFWLEA